MMKTTTNTVNAEIFRKIQRNIRRAGNRYQVRKNVNGKSICKSFPKLNQARMFLKTL